MGIQITWLGHAAFQLQIDDYAILIDPFLTGNPLAAVDPATVEAHYIALTHAHGDHIGDTPSIAKRTGATVIANFEIGNWLKDKGVEHVHAMSTGGGVQLPFGRVELTHAIHGSSFPGGQYGGLANGILIITQSNFKIYHAGDTCPFLDMQLIGERGIDLALLPIGDYFTMGIDGSLRAIEMLRPKVVIPMHYNTFDPIAQDVVAWAQRVHNQTDSKPVVLDPGGQYTI
jgi:L-ascorbate metabolism protein UlaG (beta-lactamase superfamily)